MTEDSKDKFFLQYYFPPSSVGETGRTGAPGRREIGHGQLAQRALTPIIPNEVSGSSDCVATSGPLQCCFHQPAQSYVSPVNRMNMC